MRPWQVGRVVLIEGEHAHDAVAHLVLVTEHAGRQRNRTDVLRVEVSLAHRGQPFVASSRKRLDVLELLVEDRHVAFAAGVDRCYVTIRSR